MRATSAKQKYTKRNKKHTHSMCLQFTASIVRTMVITFFILSLFGQKKVFSSFRQFVCFILETMQFDICILKLTVTHTRSDIHSQLLSIFGYVCWFILFSSSSTQYTNVKQIKINNYFN